MLEGKRYDLAFNRFTNLNERGKEMWVLKKGNLFVSSNPNVTKSSYTNNLANAKLYTTKESAVNDSCPENEKPYTLESQFIK